MDAKTILAKLISFDAIEDRDNSAIMDYLESFLTKIGFRTEYRSKCLVMSIGDEQPIGFLGHTDTVSCSDNWKTNPFELVENGGKLYGLGVCDMKGGLAAMLAAVAKVDWKNRSGIKLFFTFDEEIGFGGIKELLDKKIDFPDFMIIGEPTDNIEINSSRGEISVKLRFRGKAAHSSVPEEGENAICKAMDFASELKKDVNGHTATMNIGLINGGRLVNIVPDSCEMSIDFRTEKPEQNAYIKNLLDDLSVKYDAKYEVIDNILPFVAERDVRMCNYITEASFLDGKKRIILGAGPINAHVDNEYITVASLEKLEQQYLNIIHTC